MRPISSYLKTHNPKAFAILKHLRTLLSTVMEGLLARKSENDPSCANPTPPFDPMVPSIPISYPLKTLDELETRAYFKSFHFPFNKATVRLSSGDGGELPKRPRILVCHDMEGGYLDDRFVQGGGNADAYAIFHWYLIDVFVYFSHSLVTLPPPCWTNTAHRHGVKSLGTFIMEWDEGRKMADKLLLTKDSAQLYAARLAELALALGFDGWLINMEVTLDPGQIHNLKEFVSHLSQTLHSLVPGSLILWYDSVTVDGNLKWQNQLNDKNKPFFDLCDGIFVNYTWEKDFPKLSADVAGDRKFDVYMGIDVFGRGSYGGGQWTTNVALDVISKDEVSAAIFAPGWVYETKQPPDSQSAQNRWWGLVEKSWGITHSYPKSLPFYSNFDQGHGFHVYIDGQQVSKTSWNNISSQSFQPFIAYSGDSTSQPIHTSINFKGASYNGGGNITFNGILGADAEFTARLFQGEVLFRNSPVHIKYSVKSNGNSLIGIVLEFNSTTKDRKSVFLASSGNTLLTMSRFSSHYTHVVMPHKVSKMKEGPEWIVQESSIDMNGQLLTEIRAVCYKPNIEKSVMISRDKTQPGAPSEYYAVLGDIKITTSGENPKLSPPSTAWTVVGQFISWNLGSQGSTQLSLKIMWKLEAENVDPFPNYNLYVVKEMNPDRTNENTVVESAPAAPEYLGTAAVKAFYISALEVPTGFSHLKFIIQACGMDGSRQELDDSPFFSLEVPDLS